MNGAAEVMPQGLGSPGREAVPTDDEIEGQHDSQDEWEGEAEELERGEGSGESEGSERGEEEDGENGSASDEEVEEEDEEEEEEDKEEEVRQEEQHDVEEEAEDENMIAVETSGVRDISVNDRVQHSERHRRVAPLPLAPQVVNPTPTTTTTTPLYTPATSPHAHQQWLLELALVLLVTTLLVAVCSRLSYHWLVQLFTINPEKPI